MKPFAWMRWEIRLSLFVLASLVSSLEGQETERRYHLLVTQTMNGNVVDFYNTYISSGYNDDETKSTAWPLTTYQQGDFVTLLDPTSPPVKMCLEVFGLKSILMGVCFDSTGAKVTDLASWCTTERLLFAYPYDSTAHSGLHVTASTGNFELTLTSLDDDSQLWFTVQHQLNSTSFILTPNETSPLNYMGDFQYHGCISFQWLDLVTMFTDPQLSLLECCRACDSLQYPYAAIKFSQANQSFTCNCASFRADLMTSESFCDQPCPGEPSYTCGAATDGFYSVYTGNFSLGSFNVSSGQALKYNVSISNESLHEYLVTLGDVLTQQFLFIEGYAITARDAEGHFVNFSVDTSSKKNETNCTGMISPMSLVGDGKHVNVTTRSSRFLCLYFERNVTDLQIQLYGPDDGCYIEGQFMAIVGIYEIPSVTSTLITPTPTINWLSETMISESHSTVTITETITQTVTSSEFMTSVATTVVTSTMFVSVSTVSVSVTPSSSGNVCSSIFACSPSQNVLLEQKVEELVANLTVPVKTLSSYKRRYTSAADPRASSAAIGAFGIITLVFLIGSLVVLDAPALVHEFSRLRKRIRFVRKRLCSYSVREETSSPVYETEQGDLTSCLSVYEPSDLENHDTPV